MMALGVIGFILSFTLCGAILHFGLNGWLSGVMTMSLFALARSFYGLLGSAAPPAVQAYVASRTGRAERTKALALVASSFGLGTVLGPALAPLMILPGVGLVGPFAVFAIMGVIVLVLLRTRLPDDDPRFAGRGEVMAGSLWRIIERAHGSRGHRRTTSRSRTAPPQRSAPAPVAVGWADRWPCASHGAGRDRVPAAGPVGPARRSRCRGGPGGAGADGRGGGHLGWRNGG